MNFTEKKSTVKDILNNSPIEYPLSRDLVNFVESYIVEHHQSIDTLKIDKLWVKPNPTFKHNNFYFNGTINGEKVVKQLLGTSNVSKEKNIDMDQKRLIQAMREAVGNDLHEYKKYMLLIEHQCNCNLCGKLFGKIDEIHVDHCGEKEFRHIKDEFLSVKPNLIVEKRSENDYGLTRLQDNEDKDLWIDYHHSVCKLQLICKDCNLKKGKR